jgi:hypothetical protein
MREVQDIELIVRIRFRDRLSTVAKSSLGHSIVERCRKQYCHNSYDKQRRVNLRSTVAKPLFGETRATGEEAHPQDEHCIMVRWLISGKNMHDVHKLLRMEPTTKAHVSP